MPELVAGFGYNQGYLLQIVEQPPGRVESPPDVIRPRGPLCCSYDDPRLRAIEALAPAAEKLAAGAAGWEEHAQSIPARQAEAEKSGRGVWSTGLSVEGFTPAGYAQLLALSSSFLEVTQAVALSALSALCEGDTDSGRRAALAHACLLPWTGSYAMGLMDPRPDDLATGAALPRIVS